MTRAEKIKKFYDTHKSIIEDYANSNDIDSLQELISQYTGIMKGADLMDDSIGDSMASFVLKGYCSKLQSLVYQAIKDINHV